ncbi:MAG: ammonium transporter [Clostridiales bacterium]
MKKRAFTLLLSLILIFSLSIAVFAEDTSEIDKADTGFILIAAALVFFMTPGLALFYGGMVRRKNVLNTMLNTYVMVGLVTIQWVFVGYSIAFGQDAFGGIFGNFDYFGFNNVGLEASGTIPHMAFAVYQLMFAIITVGILTGAFAERIKFSVLIVFAILWTTLVYDPLAHWVWSADGWLLKMNSLDFAGGTVVHISSGVSGLVAAIVIGKRKGYGKVPIIPHNIPFVFIGAAILWFGWFGFNAGSALESGALATSAFVVTHIAAATALFSWVLVEFFHRGKATLLGAATGGVVGLVAITPASGFVTPLSAIIIGLVVSPLCYISISYIKSKVGYDDSLDAFGCHGIGGIWGAVATGLFATKSVNPDGQDGLFYGNPGQMIPQLVGIGATLLISIVGTIVILKVISLFTSLRVETIEEDEGLDISQHGEDAYPDFNTSNESII